MALLHLVGHDGTDHGDDALALARDLDAGRGVRRVIVHVLRRPVPTQEAAQSLVDALGPAALARLRQIRTTLAGDEALEVVVARSPAQGLHDRAGMHQADLVAVGADHRSFGPIHVPLSTVAGRLMSGGPWAVALAPDGYARRPSGRTRVVVGFDGSHESRCALAEAAALAVGSGAKVDVVCAYDPADVPRSDRTADALAAAALGLLPEAVRGLGVGRPGSSGSAIKAFAADQDAALVVLGLRGHSPLRRVHLGSTGRHVLHESTRPVLIVPQDVRAAG